MNVYFYFVIATAIIYLLIYAVFLLQTKEPVTYLFLYSIVGIVSLVLVNVIGKYIGIGITYNAYTVVSASVGGIPAVISMLILQIIFI